MIEAILEGIADYLREHRSNGPNGFIIRRRGNAIKIYRSIAGAERCLACSILYNHHKQDLFAILHRAEQ